MIARLKRWFDIRRGEGFAVLACFLYMAVTVASFLLAKPIRNGLFLTQFGATKLVYVFVGVPLALSLFVPIYTRVAARFGQRLVITGTLVFFVLNVLAFWYGFTYAPRPWMYAAFYIWVNCYGIIAPVQAWTFANTAFDTRQARRLFGVIGGGASLGAIVGGFLAQVLVGRTGTVNLLLVLAGLIALGAVIVNLAWRVRRRDAEERVRPRQGARLIGTFRRIWNTPYLRGIACLVLLVAIVTQWSQFQFSLLASERFAGNADRLTRFFGEFNFYMGVVAFFVQMLLTGPALRRFGIGATILILPLALGLGSTLILLYGTLWAVLLTNGFDQGLRFSIDKATFELLYLPIPTDSRTTVKSAIDLIVNRVGDGLGGFLLGVLTEGFNLMFVTLPGFHLGLRGLAAANLVLIVFWIGVALFLRRAYVTAIEETIQHHRLDAERASAQLLDRSTADILAHQLGSSEADDILYALSVFELEHKRVSHPAVRGLLSHPVAAVRRRAISLLDTAGDLSVMSRIEQLLNDPDLGTRTEALLYLAHHADIDPLEHIKSLGDFGDLPVRAGMVAFLSKPGHTQNLDAARLILHAMVSEQGVAGDAVRLEAARLLRTVPDEFGPDLQRLINDPNPAVAKEAIVSAGELGRAQDAPYITARLDTSELVEDCIEALVQLGNRGLPAIRQALADGSPREVQLQAPHALARIGTAEAQQVLIDHLLSTDPLVRFRVISALNKHREAFPELRLDQQAVEMVLTAEIIGHYRSYQLFGTLGAVFQSGDPVVSGLRASMEQEVERIFRLMSLLWPTHDFHSAYVGVWSKSASIRANAIEFLDNVLKPELRTYLIPLFDPQVSIAERVQRANQLMGMAESRENAVATLLASDDPWLKSCGAYAVGTLRLTSMSAQLDAARDHPDPLVRQTVRDARERLEAPPAIPAPATQSMTESGAWHPPQETYGVG